MRYNRPRYHVINNGRSITDITDWSKELATLQSSLTEEEKRSPFAKYYYRDIIMPDLETLKAFDAANPLPKELALRPEEFVRALDSDRINGIRSGYYRYDDGIAFSITRLMWPGVTDEKLIYFNENFKPEGDLFYKIWFPGLHLRHFEGAAIEDVGAGMELVHFTGGTDIDGLTGVENYHVKDPKFAYFNCGCGVSYPLSDLFEKPRYAVMATYVLDRPEIDGRELIIAFWQGMTIKDGKPVRAVPKEELINEEHGRVQGNHAAWEYTQMCYLINKFCEDRK